MRAVTHPLAFIPALDVYIIHSRETKRANTKDGGRREGGGSDGGLGGHFHKATGLINNPHISELHRIKSDTSCFRERPRAPGLIEKHLTSNQRAHVCSFEITCHFRSLSRAYQLAPFLCNPPPTSPVSLSLPPSLAVITVCVSTAHSSGTLLLYTPACMRRMTQSTRLSSGGKKTFRSVTSHALNIQCYHQNGLKGAHCACVFSRLSSLTTKHAVFVRSLTFFSNACRTYFGCAFCATPGVCIEFGQS